MKREFIVAVLLALSMALRSSGEEHPVTLEKDADTPKCLECHDEKNKGKHVHSAIAMGCTACHEVKTEKDTTNINFVAPKDELCVTCHEKASGAVQHGPYEKRQCVICHEPHASDFENNLRGDGNALCLECHFDRRSAGETVVLFKALSMPNSEFEQIPKIELDSTLKVGHPLGMHAVADAPDLLHPGKKITCLTCHENHAAAQAKLIRMAETKEGAKKMDVCDACHLARDNARMDQAQKRTDEQEAQRQKEQQLQKKAPLTVPHGPPPKNSGAKQQ